MVALINSWGCWHARRTIQGNLGDVIMPDRDIDTLFDNVDKPEEPEEQPEDIAQPELDLAPLAGVDVSVPKPKANFAGGGSFFRDGEYIPLIQGYTYLPKKSSRKRNHGICGCLLYYY